MTTPHANSPRIPTFVVATSGRNEPSFSDRKVNVSAVINSGRTVVLELQGRTDGQLVQDTDGKGNIITSRTDYFTRRMLVFVTAKILPSAHTTGTPSPAKASP